MTRAPQSVAILRVASFDCESTTTISSAQETDSHAARMFSSSLKVMIEAVIFIGNFRLPIVIQVREIHEVRSRNRQAKTQELFLWFDRVLHNYVVRMQGC